MRFELGLRLTTLRNARRAGALSMALLQLVAFSALPTADAVLDASQLGLPLHVESEGNPECAPHHDHLFCQVVRSMSSATRPAEIGSVADSPPAILRLKAQTSAADLDTRRLLTRSIGPRAPPLA